MLPAHLRVGPTGNSCPGWIRAIQPDGKPSTPQGRSAAGGSGALMMSGHTWHAIDGTCELFLPQGVNTLLFSRLPGWHVESFNILVASGQLAARVVPIPRSPKPSGYLEIDLGCHGISPGVAWFEGRASGLDGVQLVAKLDPPGNQPSMLEFSGSETGIDRLGCHVQINTFNTGGILGNLLLLDCHRPVFPLSLTANNDFPTWSLSDWWSQCHRKRGLVIWADCERNHPAGQGEALAGVILGKVDGFECLDLDPSRAGGLELWNDLLACGLAPALVGSSGARSKSSFPGRIRTLVASQSSPWVTAVANGHATLTSGPSLISTLSSMAPGHTIHADIPVILNATWDLPTWPGQGNSLVLELFGGQGVFWRFEAAPNQTELTAEFLIPYDSGPQIALRASLTDGSIVAQTSGFRLADRNVTVSSSTLDAVQRLFQRLEHTRSAIVTDPQHSSRSGEVICLLDKAATRLKAVVT